MCTIQSLQSLTTISSCHNKSTCGFLLQVQNELDECYYAVKKIVFGSNEPDVWFKVMTVCMYFVVLLQPPNQYVYTYKYHDVSSVLLLL